MTTGLVAVRRNLTPGAVFFRQQGTLVEYSLDGETWRPAFILPRENRPSVPPQIINTFADKTINEYITLNNQQFFGSVNVANIYTLADNVQTRLSRNLCAASKLLAATFVAIANEAKQHNHESYWQSQAAGAGVATAGIGILLFMAGPLGWIALGASTISWLTGAGIAIGSYASLSAYLETLDSDIPELTAADADLIACYIYRNTKNPSVGKAGIQNALFVHFDDLDAPPDGTPEAFAEMFDAIPNLYTSWLAGLTDQEVIPCECGGCFDTLGAEWTPGVNQGYRLLNGGLSINPTRGGQINYYQLGASYELDEPYINNQVDSVRLHFLTTGYATPDWALRTTISGPFSQSNMVQYSVAQMPPPGVQVVTVDFSAVTLAHGVSTVSIQHRLNYSSYLAASGDANVRTILTAAEICLRGP